MRFYIGGPMRGYPEFNFPAFHKAAQELRELGFEVFSPAERDLAEGFDPKVDKAHSMRYYMKHDLPMVLESDATYLLEGWEFSRGARLEHKTARTCDIPVIYEGHLTLDGVGKLLNTYLIGGYEQDSDLIVVLEKIFWQIAEHQNDVLSQSVKTRLMTQCLSGFKITPNKG